MIRTFNSIGHGGFYTEEFSGYTMIYDCGGRSKSIIKSEIENSLLRKQRIDTLFISHLHYDHINGLEFLLKHCNVQKIYLPYLSYKQKIKLIIENKIFGKMDPFVHKFILNPVEIIASYSKINEETQIFYILPVDSEEFKKQPQKDRIDNRIQYIRSGDKINVNSHKTNCEWVYIPFNYENLSNTELIVSELEEIGITLENLNSKIFSYKDEIINIYIKILGDKTKFNENSMTVYSGPDIVYPNNKKFIPTFISQFSIMMPFIRFNFPPACLYLGDFNAKKYFDLLLRNYKPYWDYIGTIQIPHHGSSHNFNEKLFRNKRVLFSIMSVNKNSRHPHSKTYKSIVKHYSFPIIITEDSYTKFIQRFEC